MWGKGAWLVYPLWRYHPYSSEFMSSLPGCSFGNHLIATYLEQSDFSSFHFKLPSATKFGYTCFGGWYELRLESLNNPDAIKVCKILPWCHGLYRCTQLAVSSFFLHTELKTSKIYFSLHLPCAWGLNELILSFCVFVKIFCFYWNMFLIKNIIPRLCVFFWNKYVYGASARRRVPALVTHPWTGNSSLSSALLLTH